MAGSTGPERAGFAAAPWGQLACNRERPSRPSLWGPATLTPRNSKAGESGLEASYPRAFSNFPAPQPPR